MKITKIEAIALRVPICAQTPSPGLAETGEQILVRVETSEGMVGWGGCFAYGVPRAICTVVEEIAPLVIEEPFKGIEAAVSHLERRTANWSREGLARFAIAGIELALWDLEGKERGVPVHKLIGGTREPRKAIPAYCSLPRFGTPEDVAEACGEVVKMGYSAVKLHQIDVASVAAAREAVGPAVALMLDVNCPWSVEEACVAAREIERFELRWLEEPTWPPEDHQALASLRAAIGIKVACGENDATVYAFRNAIAVGAADILQPSLLKVGGLTEMQRIAEVVANSDAELAPHSYYRGPGFAASVHFAAVTPSVTCLEVPYGETEVPICAAPISQGAGVLTVPDQPGLGADPTPEVLRRCRL